jgi:HlyD family secretion protein
MKRHRLLAWSIAGVLLAATVSVVAVTRTAHLTPRNDEVPLAEVKRGEIDLRVHATGELQASHSTMLAAPAVGGDALQITRLSHTGGTVKKGDIVIEFDPSEQHYKLEQNQSEMLQAEQEITKANADAAVLAAQDKVALLKARYDVRRAELDVQKKEIVSKIDADKNQLALSQTQRVLAELEKDVQSHTDSGQASIFLAKEKANKAKLAMNQARDNLKKMQVTAPMDGLVSIQKNMTAAGGLFFTGMTLPDYHAGDQAEPGSAIAQVVDPMGMKLVSKVSERNHSNVKQGQSVKVRFDAFSGREFRGTVKSVAGMSMRQFFDAPSGGTFDVSIELADMDSRLRSGFTGQILFIGDTQQNVLYLPRQAIFLKDGKRIVYVSKGNGYDQREVKVSSESESRAAIEGLDEGTRVALIDPTVTRKPTSGAASAGSLGGTP